MKRLKLIFPLMFLVALGGSAFTRFTASSRDDSTIAYFQDNVWFTCDTYQVEDDNCVVDNLQYPCKEYVGDFGWQVMYRNNAAGQICYQPFYSYFPNNPADPN